jgi:hypothetical protein
MTQTIHPFDLQARAALATSGLTGLLDPQREGLMYFIGSWRARPPRADHNLWDCGDGCGRFTDALALARSMLGSGSPAARRGKEDEQIEAWVFRFLGQDGLSWLPAAPWAAPWGAELLLAGPPDSRAYAEISWAQRATLMGLITRFLLTGEERYVEAARRLVDGLLKIAVRHPDGLFFPEGYYPAEDWHTDQPGLFPGIEETNAAMLAPAVRLYEETGYSPALELAEGLARFALKHTQGYRPDGRLQAPQGGAVQEHFHTRSNFMMGVLKLGVVLGRREYVAWARQGYACAKELGTDFGWFPEHLGQRHGEICCTTDMIELALLLGRHVSPEYYADAERFGRNHLLESQFLSLEKLEEALSRMPGSDAAPPYDGKYSTGEDVARRQVGAFASRPALNDAFHLDGTDLMQCCNASGTRALYDLWSHAVAWEAGAGGLEARVHLRFSVATPQVKVVSHEPARGRLDVTARRDCQVAVRMPAGVVEALVVYAGERVQAVTVVDGYARFPARKGERVEVHYPLDTRTTTYRVGKAGRDFHCTGYWRGETLMRVEPPGPFYPLYGRREDLAPVEPQLPGTALVRSI